MDANGQKIAVMVFKELGIKRDKWSAMACCRILFTVNKGSATVTRGQYEHERHSVLTGVQMPEADLREIMTKIDKRGQGKTALLKFSMAMFREHDQGPGPRRLPTCPLVAPHTHTSHIAPPGPGR